MQIVNIDYANLKAIILSKLLFWQFLEFDTTYTVFAIDENAEYQTTLYKPGFEPIGCTTCAADPIDFETNYKATANKTLALQRASPIYFRFDIPPGATKITQVVEDNISGTVDDTYLITSGKVLTIQRLACASSLSLGSVVSSKIQLFYDPNGDGSVLTLIAVLFTTGEYQETFLSDKFRGDGTRRIIIRRSILDTGARQVFAKWEGHEA
jgi:hypothetical protein